MTILFAFLLPLVAYLLAARVWRRDQGRAVTFAAAAAVVAAMLSAAVVFATVLRSPYWRDRTEIAWIGVESGTPDTPLVVGGVPDAALVGWPGAGFWPQISISKRGGGKVRVQVFGGAGIVIAAPLRSDGTTAPEQTQVLNGTFVASGQTVDVDGFRITFKNRWLLPDRLEIARGSARVAVADLRFGRSGVISVLPEIAAAVARLRIGDDPQRRALALALEDWGSQTRIYKDGKGIRIIPALQDSAPTSWPAADVAVPARLVIRWPGRTLPLELSETHDGRAKVTFLPPWRLASPMPPPVQDGKDIPLIVTTDPRPGERVFEMPFGGGLGDPRRVLTLRANTPQPQFAGGRVPRLDELVDLPPGVALDDDARRFKPAGLTSLLSVPAGPLSMQIATVQDLPTPRRLALMLAVGVLLLAVGAAFTRHVIPRSDAWSVYGLALTVWLFLNARLLLSLRYAIDPTGLDQLAVKGVGLAGFALAFIPGLFFLTIRAHRDAFVTLEHASRARHFYAFVGALATLFVVSWLQVRLAAGLWANLPSRFEPDFGWVFALLVAAVFVLFAAQAAYTYLLDSHAQARFWWLSPLSAPPKLVFVYGVRFWQEARKWRSTTGWRFLVICAALLLLYVVAAIVLGLLNVAARNQRIVQELAGPFILAGIPLLIWLSSRAAMSSARIPILSDWRALFLVSLALLAPAVFSPILLLDPGGLLATLAWFTPLAALLIALPPRRYGIWPAFWTIAVVAIAATFLVTSVRFAPGMAGMFERGVSRYLVFTRGEQAQRLLPLAQWSPELGQGIPLRSLQNTIEHGWENVAIAHRGGWLGTGFSRGPARRSMVPQETLQYDSTFSFFIVSEHGLVGGISLLLLYGAPLAIVLWNARRRLDVGHLLAVVIAAGFLGEALVHVAMNYGALPFTGRNLPLLSVNSATEVLRWAVLWCLAAQAMFWRTTADEQAFSPRFGSSVLRATPADTERPWRLAAAGVLVLPLLFFVARVAMPAVRVALDKKLDAPFGWDRLLASVQSLIDSKRIVWLPDKKEISLAPLGVKLEGGTFLEQEVARFNSLPDADKFDLPEYVGLPLGRVRTLDQYDQMLTALRRVTSRSISRRPPLFAVSTEEQFDDSDHDPAVIHRLQANPSFNIRLSFAPETEADRLPVTTLFAADTKNRTEDDGVVMLGPAWVSGTWRVAVNGDARLPWAKTLGDALVTEWARLGPKTASERYGTLTIDPELQAAAMNFVAEKGRLRHAELLAQASANPRRQLPPRVALSVVDMRDGRVLALGGWPHMASGTRWTFGSGGWSPPAEWLERHASRALARRYGRDRNFDRIELGSAGKPIWAAAALSVHPFLDRQLHVQGADDLESDVFGIQIPHKPWKVTPSGWRDFRDYLMRSDNRYQVRLGFLALAASDGRTIKADKGAGTSPSIKEALTRNPEPWHRYPEFLPDVRFSAANPKTISLLHQTPLAQALRSLFGAGIHAGDTPSFRTSMWSLADDGVADAPDVAEQFALISPESTHLRLDAVENPRQFVSHLLGGSDSRWSNVDYAAAFASVVMGKPLLPRMIHGDVRLRGGRDPFPRIAQRLRPGLAGTVRADGGTATHRLRTAGASLVFRNRIDAYGKTGTLSTDNGRTETSRLVVALVRWRDENAGAVEAGVVLSLVVERAQMGAASEWLGEFIARYEDALSRAGLR